MTALAAGFLGSLNFVIIVVIIITIVVLLIIIFLIIIFVITLPITWRSFLFCKSILQQIALSSVTNIRMHFSCSANNPYNAMINLSLFERPLGINSFWYLKLSLTMQSWNLMGCREMYQELTKNSNQIVSSCATQSWRIFWCIASQPRKDFQITLCERQKFRWKIRPKSFPTNL